MRRIPSLRAPAPSGFVPSSIQTGPLRSRAAATLASASILPQTAPRLNSSNGPTQTRRYLSTTPIRSSQSQPQSQPPESLPAEDLLQVPAEEYYAAAPEPTAIRTRLVYPRGITTAPQFSDVADPAYTPADTADGLEEVGGIADWWDEPTHWGSEGGPAQFVQSVLSPFGPAEQVTDPVVLEVLARRAVVEAVVVARFAGGSGRMSKKVDRLFAAAAAAQVGETMERLGKIARVEIVAGEDGAATLKHEKDWGIVWRLLNSAEKNARQPRKQAPGEVAEEGSATVEAEVSQESAVPETEVKEVAAAAELTPQAAGDLNRTWDKAWKKAELRDPVVKFFAAKRIQQLTGHRIPDGKLLAMGSIDSLLKQLVEPPKPKKLAELISTQGAFQELPNVRVFPRRVTPIDKEKMVGRWKIIVKELEKRELPVIGTGNYGPPVEKRWIEGKA